MAVRAEARWPFKCSDELLMSPIVQNESGSLRDYSRLGFSI
jgi:hypothetical protein